MPGLDRSSVITDDPEVARRAFGPMVPRLAFGRVDPTAFRVRLGFDAAPSFTIIEYAFAAPAATVAGSDDLVVISAKGHGFELRHGRNPVDPACPTSRPPKGCRRNGTRSRRAPRCSTVARVEQLARSVAGEAGERLESPGSRPSVRRSAAPGSSRCTACAGRC